MFYTKFQYRHDCSILFQRFWQSPTFTQQVAALQGQPVFERFLNSLINDMTFCLEEGISKLGKIKQFELREEHDKKHLTKEDFDNHRQDRQICHANFQLAGQCLWIAKQLADWCKSLFQNEAFAERIANTVNFVLKSLVGPDAAQLTQVKDPELLSFKPVELLADLATIYANLKDVDVFCRAVVKDERSFKFDYFNIALRKLKLNKACLDK